MSATLGQWVDVTQGYSNQPNTQVQGLSTDTRTLQPGEVYLALRGERFDGHDFVEAAFEKGAAAVIVDHGYSKSISKAHLKVTDTLEALQAIAAHRRRQFAIPVVAVAGSNGKTTTKHLIATLLEALGPIHSTRGTLNNHIGVPLTLLELEQTHCAAVVEIGANHPNEVAALTQLVAPTVGIVTNAGLEHLEGFGSLEGAARAEGELFEGLQAQSLAVINLDDRFASMWQQQASHCRVRTFSMRGNADVCLTSKIEFDDPSVQRFTVSVDGQKVDLVLPLAGAHNVANALAAIAVASALGVSLASIASQLTKVKPVSGRLQIKTVADGRVVVDDTYNANPSSVTAALDVLSQLPQPWAMIFGGMGELGSESRDAHVQVGREARECGVEWLWTVGGDAELATQAFGQKARHFSDVDSLLEQLRHSVPHFSTLLVKGSRFNKLERVVSAMLDSSSSVRGATQCFIN